MPLFCRYFAMLPIRHYAIFSFCYADIISMPFRCRLRVILFATPRYAAYYFAAAPLRCRHARRRRLALAIIFAAYYYCHVIDAIFRHAGVTPMQHAMPPR